MAKVYRGGGTEGIHRERTPPPKKVLVGTKRAMPHHAKIVLITFHSFFYVTDNRS